MVNLKLIETTEIQVTVKTKTRKKNGSPCSRCSGLCCRYFALPIDKPEDWKDFDDIRWYLCHENVTVFVEDGDWYLNVINRCKYLDGGSSCEIYDMRPRICRKYDTDGCDLTGDGYEYELHFTDDRQVEDYMRKKFGEKVFNKLQKKKSKRNNNRKGRT
jgi:Fe-S-cluster containining protein